MPVTETKLKKKIDLTNNITCPTLASGKRRGPHSLFDTLEGNWARLFFRKDFWDCYFRQGRKVINS